MKKPLIKLLISSLSIFAAIPLVLNQSSCSNKGPDTEYDEYYDFILGRSFEIALEADQCEPGPGESYVIKTPNVYGGSGTA
jgi:hypothetical protein